MAASAAELQRLAASKLLVQATFGPTRATVDALASAISASVGDAVGSQALSEGPLREWVHEQMQLPPTLHRAYYRSRSSPRIDPHVRLADSSYCRRNQPDSSDCSLSPRTAGPPVHRNRAARVRGGLAMEPFRAHAARCGVADQGRDGHKRWRHGHHSSGWRATNSARAELPRRLRRTQRVCNTSFLRLRLLRRGAGGRRPPPRHSVGCGGARSVQRRDRQRCDGAQSADLFYEPARRKKRSGRADGLARWRRHLYACPVAWRGRRLRGVAGRPPWVERSTSAAVSTATQPQPSPTALPIAATARSSASAFAVASTPMQSAASATGPASAGAGATTLGLYRAKPQRCPDELDLWKFLRLQVPDAGRHVPHAVGGQPLVLGGTPRRRVLSLHRAADQPRLQLGEHLGATQPVRSVGAWLQQGQRHLPVGILPLRRAASSRAAGRDCTDHCDMPWCAWPICHHPAAR